MAAAFEEEGSHVLRQVLEPPHLKYAQVLLWASS
jgi:hypothetical protein